MAAIVRAHRPVAIGVVVLWGVRSRGGSSSATLRAAAMTTFNVVRAAYGFTLGYTLTAGDRRRRASWPRRPRPASSRARRRRCGPSGVPNDLAGYRWAPGLSKAPCAPATGLFAVVGNVDRRPHRARPYRRHRAAARRSPCRSRTPRRTSSFSARSAPAKRPAP